MIEIKQQTLQINQKDINDDGDYIPIKPSWSMKRLKQYCYGARIPWVPDCWDYNIIGPKAKNRALAHYPVQLSFLRMTPISKLDLPPEQDCELDPMIWEPIENTLTTAYNQGFIDLQDFGINDIESHFITMAILHNSLKRLRLDNWIALNYQGFDRKKFETNPLRNAINCTASLIQRHQFDTQKILWSERSTWGQVSDYKHELKEWILNEIIHENQTLTTNVLMI